MGTDVERGGDGQASVRAAPGPAVELHGESGHLAAGAADGRALLGQARARQRDVLRWVDEHFNEAGRTFPRSDDQREVGRLLQDALETVYLLFALDGTDLDTEDWRRVLARMDDLNDALCDVRHERIEYALDEP